MRVLVAPDKFKGTISAKRFVELSIDVLAECGLSVSGVPLADGGDGTGEVLCDQRFHDRARTAFGEWTVSTWYATSSLAVIEVAEIVGLVAMGGPSRRGVLEGRTDGVGDLIKAAIERGYRSIAVACGGSGTTDGGIGLVEALSGVDLRDVELWALADVSTRFLDAATLFAPQKGATPHDVRSLESRLLQVAKHFQARTGMDVTLLDGGGAAGGIAGGLASLGATIMSGFEFVASRNGLREMIAAADVVLTGEGRLDRSTLEGKVVSRVAQLTSRAGGSLRVVCGCIAPDMDVRALGPRVEASALFEDTGIVPTQSRTEERLREVLSSLGRELSHGMGSKR
ncbi:MAG: glycerate kinase [Acidimicrobiales bacterium]